ncbi:MAG: zinc-dependent alcohol dehydrogenase family protein [Gammaproteobacteria bacterium]|nr:zinc-dependent alcohol dehydrogenase family protein [Gammaproteobacteria bacterium]
MKASIIEASGGPECLTYKEAPVPELTGANQVLVRIHSAGINPIDTKIRSAADRFPIELPAILGCDAAGVIETIGDQVDGFAVGDEVFWCQVPFNGRCGNYAEYAVVDAALLAKKPANIDFNQAAAAPLVLITAWEALFDRYALRDGQRVLVQAGAGGVGHVAIQLAKQAGARVITTVSTEDKADFVRSLGADEVINYREQDVHAAVMDWTEGEGVDMALDTVGGKVLSETFPCVRVYGDVVTILQPAADTDWSQARLRNLRTSLELMLSPTMLERPQDLAHQGEILRQAAGLFAEGKLKVEVARRFPLAEATKAHRFLEQEAPMGKVVLEVA